MKKKVMKTNMILPKNLDIEKEPPYYQRTQQPSECIRCSFGFFTYHRALYKEVAGPRVDGYAISVIRTGAADAAKVNPNPIINLPKNKTMKS